MHDLDYADALPQPRLDVSENCPDIAEFLKGEICAMGAKSVADVGGGANPALNAEFVQRHNIDYTLLDISQAELDKAPVYFRKIQVDLAGPSEDFSTRVGEGSFDIVFSHFFLEHVRDPLAVHRNIHTALRPGGLAIHYYPTPYNIPLALNRVLSESVSGFLVGIAHPTRDLKVTHRKFPAFYAMCGYPSRKSHAKFRQLGFDVVRHTGYIGHDYYEEFGLLRRFERGLRPILLNVGIPLTANALLVLRKRSAGSPSPH